MKGAANLLTVSRIPLALLLLTLEPMTAPFFAVYLLCGLSDMLDGPIARRSGSVSELGAKLDSVADFVFAAVCLWRLLPLLHLSIPITLWIAAIAVVRIVNLISLRRQGMSSELLHTTANRLTGGLLFLLPLSLPLIPLNISAIPLCAMATFAAVQEQLLLQRQ